MGARVRGRGSSSSQGSGQFTSCCGCDAEKPVAVRSVQSKRWAKLQEHHWTGDTTWHRCLAKEESKQIPQLLGALESNHGDPLSPVHLTVWL